MNRIPLDVFVNAIPKTDISEKGIKFNNLYKVLLNGKTGTRYNRNNALRDLTYYVELGNFFKIQNENHQPQYYQTNVNNYDYVTEYIRPLLDRKFKTISDNWKKLNKKNTRLMCLEKKLVDHRRLKCCRNISFTGGSSRFNK